MVIFLNTCVHYVVGMWSQAVNVYVNRYFKAVVVGVGVELGCLAMKVYFWFSTSQVLQTTLEWVAGP